MALRWIEGFEAHITTDEIHARLYEATGGLALLADDGASSTTDNSARQDDGFLRTKPIVTSVENSWIVGFAFRGDDFTHLEDGDAAHIAFHNDAGEQCRIEIADWTPLSTKPQGAYYKFRFMRGATELCSTNEHFWVSIQPEGWIYFEFKITISDTVGSIVGRYHHIRKSSLNPSGAYTTFTWDAANTSLDSQEQGTTGADRFEMSWDTGNTSDFVMFDDMYVCDNTGAKNNDYLGKCVVVRQKPLNSGGGDGDTVDWDLAGGAASTYDAWFENDTQSEDDERLTSDTTSEVHLCVVEPLTIIGANAAIIGIRQDIHARMDTTGALDLVHFFRKTTATPAETNAGTALNVSTTSMVAQALVLEDDPNTATDWVFADMDSYQHGVRNDG